MTELDNIFKLYLFITIETKWITIKDLINQTPKIPKKT